jgi:hypothetical protein
MTGHPDLDTPAGATSIAGWDGGTRIFDGREWTVEGASEGQDITIAIHGIQFADGHVVSRVAVGGLCPDWPITSSRARRLARILIAAADAAENPDDLRY